jgi:hypothetical protein
VASQRLNLSAWALNHIPQPRAIRDMPDEVWAMLARSRRQLNNL